MKRDLRLDSLRGLLLAEITLVHTGSPLGGIVNEFFGRVSTAAAFIFLSGLIAGAVYSRTAEKGTREIVVRSIRRVLLIHSYHVCTFLFLLAVVVLEPRANNYFHFEFGEQFVTIWHTAMKFSALMYQPTLFDILPLYTIFVLFMPFALLAFQRGYSSAIIAVSLALWGLGQMGLGGSRSYGGSYFNPIAWQLLFFSGLFIGNIQIHRQIRIFKESKSLILLCIIVVTLGFTLRWNIIDWPEIFDRGTLISGKPNYGIAYLVNFFAFAYLIFCLSCRFPRFFSWRPFAFLGQHAVQVFSFHVLVIYLSRPLKWRIADHSWWAENILALAIVLSLFSAAFLHRKFQLLRAMKDQVKEGGGQFPPQ